MAEMALKKRPPEATAVPFVAIMASLTGLTSFTAGRKHNATQMLGPAKDLCTFEFFNLGIFHQFLSY